MVPARLSQLQGGEDCQARLCEHLTATEATFPGTNWLLLYQIKNQR